MPVRCNGRKDIVLSKAFDMYVLVAFKAIIFYLRHYIFIAIDIMLKKRTQIILSQYILFYLSNQLHLRHRVARFHLYFLL
jgi:hypothetical protein